MEEGDIDQRNPWNDDGRTFGALKDVLAIAERHGYLKRPVDGEDDKPIQTEKASSVRLIKQLQLIDARRKELSKANYEIQQRLQDKETRDLTHTHVVEERIKKVNILTGHLQSVTNHKEQLISRLQEPFVGDYLKIEATYHKYACEIFPKLSPVLADLASQLDNIDWAAKVNLKDGQLEVILDDISSQLAALQTHFTSVNHLRHMMDQLYSQQATPR